MKDPTQIIIFEPAKEHAKKTNVEKVKAILEKDFDDFKRTRAYVLKHMGYLRGKTVPIEVGSIQSLPSHECIIINDLLLMSFQEVLEMIVDLKMKEKKNGRERSEDTD